MIILPAAIIPYLSKLYKPARTLNSVNPHQNY
jgi:hypothetical protein